MVVSFTLPVSWAILILISITFKPKRLKRAQIATQVLFSTDLANISAGDIVLALQDDPRLKFTTSEDILNKPISKLAGSFKLVPSNSAYKKEVSRMK